MLPRPSRSVSKTRRIRLDKSMPPDRRPITRLTPVASAIALLVMASTVGGYAQAQARPFGGAWFAAKGASQAQAAATGRLPNGMLAGANAAARQQQQARQKLNRSVTNLGSAAAAIAAQQAAQAAGRASAQNDPSVPDGLAQGGLKVDGNPLTAGWLNARAPEQTQSGGRTHVNIEQTADKAILNWETFNVGKNTTVNFQQNKNWAVLNRVNDPQARPSQIQGQIKADGTVMVVNRNGVVFSGSSQVNVRNLVAAAATITDSQFQNNGIYGANTNTPTFADAVGKIDVRAGAQIATHDPGSVTEGGGYVLLVGNEVSNAGQITARKGQAALAAGDRFIIRKGVGTDENTFSTVRGNEIAVQRDPDGVDENGHAVLNSSGKVTNTGLIQAREGDVTLAGHDVRQQGVAVATTTVNTRGTVHLLNAQSDATGQVTLGKDAVTAVLIEDDGQTALDSQREALIKESGEQDLLRGQTNAGPFDNYSKQQDRRDQSRIEIVSGGSVVFEGDSLTLATGGQIVSDAKGRSFVADRAQVDVSGAVGVQVAMEANNVLVNIQGNELRDAPINRDDGNLANGDVWVDRRQLVLVPAGTDGYESDRWYTGGRLLEVAGYLGNAPHRVGEWAAQGGAVLLGGNEVITQAGSRVNLAGGTLDVQSGSIRQNWLRGADGRLYTVDAAPADLLYAGLYRGYEDTHARWGHTNYYYNPLIGPTTRWESGYTVGRDAGRLIVSAPTAVLEGDIDASVYNGARQTRVRDALDDGYGQAQTAVAQAGRLLLGRYGTSRSFAGRMDVYDTEVVIGDIGPITLDLSALDALPESRSGTLWLDAGQLNDWMLGGLDLATAGTVTIDDSLVLADGGELVLTAPVIDFTADVTARGGRIAVTNLFTGSNSTNLLRDEASSVTVGEDVTLDVRGLWVNTLLNPETTASLAWLGGGTVSLISSGDVTVSAGSLIDVSSGGAVLADRSTRGARGGSVSLLAGDRSPASNGTLTLDGTVLGYGTEGGGTLSLQTGESWVIGGSVLERGGELGAGEQARIDLVLDEELVLQPGDITPIELRLEQSRSDYAPGETLAQAIVWSGSANNYKNVSILVGQAWAVPDTLGSVYADGTRYFGYRGDVVPANATITRIYGGDHLPGGAHLPAGYYIDPAVFPNGFDLGQTVVHTQVVSAGSPVPEATTLAAGTLLPAGTVPDQVLVVRTPSSLKNLDGLLQSGFSRYELNAQRGLAVVGNTTLAPVVPTWQFREASLSHPSGSDPSEALDLVLAPLFIESPQQAVLTQRPGADLVLRSGSGTGDILSGGSLYVGESASLSVDPLRQITLASGGQITVEGRLEAPGGGIQVLNQASHDNQGPGDLSVWIGGAAVLDAAGRSYSADDARGRRYGTMFDGGRITLGSLGGITNGNALSTDAFVVVRPGAILDVSGASAQWNVWVMDTRSLPQSMGRKMAVASHGGEIALRSYSGIYNEGTLRAAAGGAGVASGGSLVMELESPVYRYAKAASEIPEALLAGRVLTVSQDTRAATLPKGLRPGQGGEDSPLVVGQAGVSVAQIEAGGFDSVRLLGREAIAFDGDLSLNLGRSLTLAQGTLVNTVEGAQAALSAPYVLLDGRTTIGTSLQETVPDRLPTYADSASLFIDASLIDVRNRVGAEFADFSLVSNGHLRLLASGSLEKPLPTFLANTGNLALSAAVVYPASHAVAAIYAGASLNRQDSNVTFGEPATLTIGQAEGAPPTVPYSVFGDLTLMASRIVQGGTLWAPLGSIALGKAQANNTAWADSIDLLSGSLTSVSAKGLVMPYGGTPDGVNYTVDGKKASAAKLITGQIDDEDATTGITLQASAVVSQAGSRLDVSGGGELLGSAFVSGRGGSVDALLYPRIPGNQVYALVPGVATAPAAGGYYTEWSGDVPGMGQQITVPQGVPGLVAGVYTLLPANYALLPGAYRVELGAQTLPQGSRVTATRGGSYVFKAATGIANTSIHDALTTTVTLTPGDVVRTWSQYDETSYADFQLAQAELLSTVRPMLERDGKFLNLELRTQAAGNDDMRRAALVFEGEAEFGADEGGYDGALTLVSKDSGGNADLVITGPGSQTQGTDKLIPVAADTINAIGAANLYIGGVPKIYPARDQALVEIDAVTSNLTLESGVVLRGAQIFLTTLSRQGKLTLESGAGVSTLGRMASLPDSSLGYRFSNFGLAVSSGWIDLAAPKDASASANTIEVKDGAFLYAEGSLGFSAGGALTIEGTPQLGARDLSLASSSLNIGNADTLAAASVAGVLPEGLAFDQVFFDKLLQGDAASGAPAAETLTLTASSSINFLGSVELSSYHSDTGASLLDEMVFNAPAVYGYGNVGDVATVATDTLVWGGSYSKPGGSKSQYTTPTPGAVDEGGPGTGRGALQVQAREIVLGFPQRGRPSSQVDLNRLILGFSDVALVASERILGNHTGHLSVYQAPDAQHLGNPGFAYDAASYAGSGGSLDLVTPLLTGEAGSTFSYRAGGALALRAPEGGSANPAAVDELGAIINLSGDTIDLGSTVALPSGRLTLTAERGIFLHAGAQVDLSGRRMDLFDLSRYSWGGDFVAESGRGDIVMAAGAVIDVSAAYDEVTRDGAADKVYRNDAGLVQFTATDVAAGKVRLDGAVLGAAGKGHRGSVFDLRAQRLGDSAASLTDDFAALNTRLNEGGVLGGRSFVLKQGDLVIGDALRAQDVRVSVDSGSLTVNGRIDASGAAPGTIGLAARDDLVLAGSAVLDVHGGVLQVDHYGQAIEAKNRGKIELASAQGWLRLQPGATLDLSSPDGTARGRVELNTGRTGETSGDARIDAGGPVHIDGADSISLNAFWRYSPTDEAGTIVQDNGSGNVVDGQGRLGLDQIDTRSIAFIDAALGNGNLATRTAGLRAYGGAYHLRPGVEIHSGDTPGGKLTVASDLDLSKYRYGPDADRNAVSAGYGAGEPLSLVVRAENGLTIRGSISDGFGQTQGKPPVYGEIGDISNDPSGNFIRSGVWYRLAEGKIAVMSRDWTIPATWSLSSSTLPTDVAGNVYQPGDTIQAGTELVTFRVRTGDVGDVPANLFIAETAPAIPPYAGTSVYAPMLAAGSLSASIRLVSGADLGSADTRTRQAASTLGGQGDLLLDDPHPNSWNSNFLLPSVIRTGTGDLELLAGGDFSQASPFGVYTAGTQVDLDAGVALVPGTYVSDHGGDLRLFAQGNLRGYQYSGSSNYDYYNSFDVDHWLKRTGNHATGERAAWSINFGQDIGGRWEGFTGFGALGGGNLDVGVGGDAGVFDSTGSAITVTDGLVLAVGASGYVTSVAHNENGEVTGGTLKQYGGGDVDVRIAGRLNPGAVKDCTSECGSFTNVRGDLDVQAAAIGGIALDYGFNPLNDFRQVDPYRASMSTAMGGLALVLGDSTAGLRTLGDMVLDGVGDAGQINSTSGNSWLSLWTDHTAINLFSAGGNMAPLSTTSSRGWRSSSEYRSVVVPARFEAVAPAGSLYYGGGTGRIELAPAQAGGLTLVAGDSIYGAGFYTADINARPGASVQINVSGSASGPNDIPNPFKPATEPSASGFYGFHTFSDSVTLGSQPRSDGEPIRIYAVNGDISNVLLGEHVIRLGNRPRVNFYAASTQPARVLAGGDILNFGTGTAYGKFQPSLIVNRDPDDVSVISAGGNIYHLNVQVGGPGTLEVTAGGHIYQGDQGGITSIGPVLEGDTRPGASIAVQAGAGMAGPDWTALAGRYLDPANQADTRPGYPLADQPGKVAHTYDEELLEWLAERYGYEAVSATDALVYFAALAPEQQRIFLRSVYYAELKAGGREYNDPDSSRYGSYLRGRQAIAMLFPEQDAQGNDIARGGDYTAFGAAGVQTWFGGDIQMLVPAGQIIVGVQGEVPPASSGLITQGQGDISLYSQGSILLGLSRIMTSFGGHILAWSAEGDINAGRGSKTTLVYTPPKRVYDNVGNASLAPQVPATGAGIATLQPIPEAPAGEVDLIAPLGTIDAGEAGIRSSGSVNVAALQVMNAANIQAQGETVGVPAIAAVNVGALTSASAASSSAATAAQDAASRSRATARQNLPSIISVQILGFGDASTSGGGGAAASEVSRAVGAGANAGQAGYQPDSVVRVLGLGANPSTAAEHLTPEERSRMAL